MTKSRPLVECVDQLLGGFISLHGFTITADGDQASEFSAYVALQGDEFVVTIVRDRGQEWIDIGTKVRRGLRRRPRSWPVGHLVAYLDGSPDPYPVSDLETEAKWLKERAGELLDSELINSKDLTDWAVRASRRFWGQRLR